MLRYLTTRVIALGVGIFVLQGSPAALAQADYAMQTAGAAKSMLLDVATAGSRLVAVGERGHILISEDGGESWSQAEVPTSVMLTRVFFLDDKLGWAVGHDGNILQSQDGGATWVLQRNGLADQARINEERLGRAKQTVESMREQLATSSDEEKDGLIEALDEADWALDKATEALDEPVYAPPLMDVWFADQGHGWAAGAYGTLLFTGNGGQDWQDWSHKVDNPDELHLNGVVGSADGTLYLASEWGYVFRSNSGGETWHAIESGYEGSFFGVLANPASQTVFAYGLLGTVYRSEDGGENWSETSSMARASLFGGHAEADGTLIFVGQGGTVVQSKDDGMSFTPLAQPSRRALHGVTPMGDGRFMVTGDGGSAVMVTKTHSPATKGEGAQ